MARVTVARAAKVVSKLEMRMAIGEIFVFPLNKIWEYL